MALKELEIKLVLHKSKLQMIHEQLIHFEVMMEFVLPGLIQLKVEKNLQVTFSNNQLPN